MSLLLTSRLMASLLLELVSCSGDSNNNGMDKNEMQWWSHDYVAVTVTVTVTVADEDSSTCTIIINIRAEEGRQKH